MSAFNEVERAESQRRAAEIAARAPAPTPAVLADLSLLLKPAVEQLAAEQIEIKQKARKPSPNLGGVLQRSAEREHGNDTLRYFTSEADQIVEVGRYTYRWPRSEEKLRVGDRVVLPANDIFDERVGTVTQLGSDYRRGLRTIVRRAATDEH